jgi:hypothetical protein
MAKLKAQVFRRTTGVSLLTLQHAASVMDWHFRALIAYKKVSPFASGSSHNRIARDQSANLQVHLAFHTGASDYVFEVRAAYFASYPAVEELIAAMAVYDRQIITCRCRL